MNKYKTYDPNEDYKKKMDEAAAAGDYASAAKYERQRNEKIKGEGLTQYEATNQYAQYLPKEQNSGYMPYDPSGSVAQAQQMLNNALAQKPGAYESSWEGQMQEMLQQILDRKPFEYDVNSDALYQQYKDMYSRQGALAMEDTMGQAAALTGGYGNSYAQTVGQQTYQGYMDQLNDRIPELYQLALSKYQMEGDALADKYALLGAQDELDYGRYRDSVADYNADLDRIYNQYVDARNYQYQQDRDAVADERYDQEWQYQLDYAEKEQAYDLALSMLQSGMMPSDAVLAASGISGDDAKKIYEQATAVTYSGGGGGGGNGTEDTETVGKELTDKQWANLNKTLQQGLESGDLSAYKNELLALQWQGYDTGNFEGYASQVYGSKVDDYSENEPLPPTDENILSLGFGPISAQKIDELVSKGLVGTKIVNGRMVLYLIKQSNNSPVLQGYR